MTNVNWSVVWQELRDNLAKQPRCPQHPDYPHINTLVQQVINDIIEVGEGGILVRSHRTFHKDFIEASRLETWWNHLVANKSASLHPGDPNNPHPWRARLVDAIMVTCLPNMIRVVNADTVKLVQQPSAAGGESMSTVEELIRQLPPELQQEVHDFAQFLLDTKVRPKQKKLRMTWAGALREFRDQFTSLELQKKALEWWGD